MRLLIMLIVVFVSNLTYGQVRINEVMSNNSIFLEEELNTSPDWIELYNFSKETVNLTGWYLSDDTDSPDKWSFPSFDLLPNEYMIVVANGSDYFDEPLLIQSNFKLSNKGETLVLSTPNLVVIDEFTFPCITENKSFGVTETGLETHYHVPTPRISNAESTSFMQNANKLNFSHEAGLYSETFSLSVFDDFGEDVHYTSDGSIPNESSPIVNRSFDIDEKFKNDGLSYIPSALDWNMPKEPVLTGHTYKFVAYNKGCPSSNVESKDYYVHQAIEERYPLPVYSITFEKDDLFGDYGILVGGITGENYLKKGKEWERRGHLQLFDPESGLVLDQDIDMRVRGRGSRKNRQKSLRLYARDEFGRSKFQYPFFKDRPADSYKRLILRSGHSDFTQTMIKDVLSSELVGDLDFEYMESETSVVFMNGEYWGIENARENMDERYLESHFGVNPDSVTILKYQAGKLIASEGSLDDFQNVIALAESKDLSLDKNYDELAARIDIHNFIDYHITELYFANWDWPINNNKVWKSNQETSKYRWMFFDCDGCFYRYALNKITELDNPNLEAHESLKLLKNLLANQSFRNTFQGRYIELMSTNFRPERIIRKIDSLERLYEPLIIEHINRWSIPQSYSHWQENLSEMRVFALQRPIYAVEQLEYLFDDPVTVYPNPSSDYIMLDTGSESDFGVEVRNQFGNLIYSGVMGHEDKLRIDTFPSGLYIIQVIMGDFRFTEKFIKE